MSAIIPYQCVIFVHAATIVVLEYIGLAPTALNSSSSLRDPKNNIGRQTQCCTCASKLRSCGTQKGSNASLRQSSCTLKIHKDPKAGLRRMLYHIYLLPVLWPMTIS